MIGIGNIRLSKLSGIFLTVDRVGNGRIYSLDTTSFLRCTFSLTAVIVADLRSVQRLVLIDLRIMLIIDTKMKMTPTSQRTITVVSIEQSSFEQLQY